MLNTTKITIICLALIISMQDGNAGGRDVVILTSKDAISDVVTIKQPDILKEASMQKTKTIILKGIDEQVHYEFAIMCRQLRTSMKDRMLYLITRDIMNHKNKTEDATP
jgi:hypothetical protein